MFSHLFRKIGLKKIAFNLLATMAITLASLSAVADDVDDAGLERGERVFNEIAGIGCKSCHGEFGEGDLGVGPYIRGATEGMVRAAIEGIDAMVVIRTMIDEQGIKDVVSYVSSLGATKIVRTLSKRGRFLPESVAVRPGTSVQIVVNNSSFKAHVFKSEDIKLEALKVPPRMTGTVRWKAPEEEGEYKLYCVDCKLKDQFFTIIVDKAVKQISTSGSMNSKLSDM